MFSATIRRIQHAQQQQLNNNNNNTNNLFYFQRCVESKTVCFPIHQIWFECSISFPARKHNATEATWISAQRRKEKWTTEDLCMCTVEKNNPFLFLIWLSQEISSDRLLFVLCPNCLNVRLMWCEVSRRWMALHLWILCAVSFYASLQMSERGRKMYAKGKWLFRFRQADWFLIFPFFFFFITRKGTRNDKERPEGGDQIFK